MDNISSKYWGIGHINSLSTFESAFDLGFSLGEFCCFCQAEHLCEILLKIPPDLHPSSSNKLLDLRKNIIDCKLLKGTGILKPLKPKTYLQKVDFSRSCLYWIVTCCIGQTVNEQLLWNQVFLLLNHRKTPPQMTQPSSDISRQKSLLSVTEVSLQF